MRVLLRKEIPRLMARVAGIVPHQKRWTGWFCEMDPRASVAMMAMSLGLTKVEGGFGSARVVSVMDILLVFKGQAKKQPPLSPALLHDQC